MNIFKTLNLGDRTCLYVNTTTVFSHLANKTRDSSQSNYIYEIHKLTHMYMRL